VKTIEVKQYEVITNMWRPVINKFEAF